MSRHWWSGWLRALPDPLLRPSQRNISCHLVRTAGWNCSRCRPAPLPLGSGDRAEGRSHAGFAAPGPRAAPLVSTDVSLTFKPWICLCRNCLAGPQRAPGPLAAVAGSASSEVWWSRGQSSRQLPCLRPLWSHAVKGTGIALCLLGTPPALGREPPSLVRRTASSGFGKDAIQ